MSLTILVLREKEQHYLLAIIIHLPIKNKIEELNLNFCKTIFFDLLLQILNYCTMKKIFYISLLVFLIIGSVGCKKEKPEEIIIVNTEPEPPIPVVKDTVLLKVWLHHDNYGFIFPINFFGPAMNQDTISSFTTNTFDGQHYWRKASLKNRTAWLMGTIFSTPNPNLVPIEDSLTAEVYINDTLIHRQTQLGGISIYLSLKEILQ